MFSRSCPTAFARISGPAVQVQAVRRRRDTPAGLARTPLRLDAAGKGDLALTSMNEAPMNWK